jgi:hypothetical protein
MGMLLVGVVISVYCLRLMQSRAGNVVNMIGDSDQLFREFQFHTINPVFYSSEHPDGMKPFNRHRNKSIEVEHGTERQQD